jgi:outer membrane protein TolC
MLQQFDRLVDITRRRYAAGSGRRQDESYALLELGLLQRRQVDALTAIDDARARLERWAGSFQNSPTPAALPDWRLDALPSVSPPQQLENHPRLVAARIGGATGEIAVELARQAYRPRWMLEAGYGHQPGDDPSGRRIADKLFAMATISLPLFTADRQDRRVDAALAERDAREARAQLVYQRLRGDLDRQLAVLKRLKERGALLEQTILPQAQATVDATLDAYETDRASFDELIRARLQYLEIELDLLETRRQQLASLARIASLINEELS